MFDVLMRSVLLLFGLNLCVATIRITTKINKNTPLDKRPLFPNPFSESEVEPERKWHQRHTINGKRTKRLDQMLETITPANPKSDLDEMYEKQLLDSFGGSSAEDTMETTTTQPHPKSGFYFLVDWNSYLEVDDQNGRKVNLRIQPKIGDPKRFYSV